jgi:hypothetical protein
MRLLPVLTSTTLLLILNAGMQSAAQLAQIENVSGAPFTATWTWAKVETKSGQAETRTILGTAQLARDKNGSTYEVVSENGHTTSIWIVDVLKNRKIEILPRDSTYHYIPIGKLPTYSMEWMFKMLQAEQQYLIDHPDSPGPDLPRWHLTALGCRQENGFNLCGVRNEPTSSTGETAIFETWKSDLGLIMSLTQKCHLARPVNDVQAVTFLNVLTDLRREEPDPQLFEIPAGYTLVPSPPN